MVDAHWEEACQLLLILIGEAGEDLEGHLLKPAHRTEEMVDAQWEKACQLLLMLISQTATLTNCLIQTDKGKFRWRLQRFLQEEGEIGHCSSSRDFENLSHFDRF